MPGDLQLIHRNVEMEVRLIDDLLDVTRIARGKIQLHLEVADVHTCVRNAVKICAEEIRGKHLKVVMHLQAGRSHVMGDMARLSQVFWNLLRNAVKFTPEEGRITISTTNIKDRLKIEIADTGIGIEPEALPRIFNAFEQGEKTPSRHFGGLGLGLSIARAVVEMHDGQLTVFSEGMNRGAVFTVELASVPVPAKLPSPTVPAAEPEEKQSLKILMVDDHPDTLGILSRLLRKCGHAVTPATSVETAIRVASQEKFDLLISDIGLPDGSGLDIMQSIKGLYDIRGIALSGYGTDEDFCKSRAAGFDEHLTKPMDIRTLREAIQRVIAPDRSHGKAGTTG